MCFYISTSVPAKKASLRPLILVKYTFLLFDYMYSHISLYKNAEYGIICRNSQMLLWHLNQRSTRFCIEIIWSEIQQCGSISIDPSPQSLHYSNTPICYTCYICKRYTAPAGFLFLYLSCIFRIPLARHNKRKVDAATTDQGDQQINSSIIREAIKKAERREQRRRLRKMRRGGGGGRKLRQLAGKEERRRRRPKRKRKGRKMRQGGGQLKSIKSLRRRPNKKEDSGEAIQVISGRRVAELPTASADEDRRRRLEEQRRARSRLREFWMEGEVYREWKRKKSTQLLLQQPQAQLAIEQLWQQLIKKV